MALRNMLVRVGADVTGLKKGMDEANSTLQNFHNRLKGQMSGISGLLAMGAGAIAGALTIKGGVQDAMKYEALMATLGEVMGESRKDFEKWQETAVTAFGMSRLQSAEMASEMAFNIKQFATSQADLTAKTTQMLEMAAIIQNKRGMQYQEVANRIRSAMNMEQDGAQELGVTVTKTAVMSSQAYKEMGDGKPWEQLGANIQKQILYHHLLAEVTGKLGTTMQDTTQRRMSAFTASLGDVRLALGQAFLPILYQVLPYLTKLMQALYRAMQYVSAFMRALFGGFKFSSKGQDESIEKSNEQAEAIGGVADATAEAGKSAEKAGKDAKGALAGFDKINILPDKSDAGGGGAGGGGADAGGGAMPELPPPPDTTVFTEAVDELVEKFKTIVQPIKDIWAEIVGYIKEKLAFISAWWKENGDMIIQGFKNVWEFVKPIVMLLVEYIWESIKGLVDGIIRFFTGLLTFFGGVFTGDWGKAWEGIKEMALGAFQAVWNFFNLTIFGGIKKVLLNIVEEVVKFGVKFVSNFKTPILKLLADLIASWKTFFKGVYQFWNDLSTWIKLFVEQKIVNPVRKLFTGIGSVGKAIWDGIKAGFKGAITWFSRSIIEPIVNQFLEIKNAFSKGIGSGLKAVVNAIRNPINHMINGLNNVKNALKLGKIGIKDIPEIPKLAQGGIATRATLAMVGEGGSPEAIAPIDKLQGYITSAVASAMQNGGMQTGGKSGDVIIKIGTETIGRIAINSINRIQRQSGMNMLRV